MERELHMFWLAVTRCPVLLVNKGSDVCVYRPSNDINPHLLNSVLVIKNMKIVCIMDLFKTSLTMHTFTSHCICHYSYDLYNYPVKGWYLENVTFFDDSSFLTRFKGLRKPSLRFLHLGKKEGMRCFTR